MKLGKSDFSSPLTDNDLKELLWESVQRFKKDNDLRISKDLKSVEQYLLENELKKADILMSKIEKDHKELTLNDFKELMKLRVRPYYPDKYMEIMDALNAKEYNHVYYDLVFNDLIYLHKWDEPKSKEKLEKENLILDNFNSWYCTGK